MTDSKMPDRRPSLMWIIENTSQVRIRDLALEIFNDLDAHLRADLAHPAPVADAESERSSQFLPTEDGEFNGNYWEGDLTDEDHALIDDAWSAYKGASDAGHAALSHRLQQILDHDQESKIFDIRRDTISEIVTALRAHPAPAPDAELEALAERLEKLADDMEKHATDDWDESEDVRSAVTALRARTAQPVTQDDEEAYQIGLRDGYENAVQDIDNLTGGDGEYFASTIPGEGCHDPEAMKKRIVERFADRTAQPVGVRVKPMEWQEHPDGGEWFSVDNGTWGISDYWVSPNPVGSDIRLHVRGHLLSDEFNTPDEAIAAAQADYEQRVLSALEPPHD